MTETELNYKVRKCKYIRCRRRQGEDVPSSSKQQASEKVAVNIHIVANDPSLAFFRIQEHVRKVLPPIIDKRNEVIELQNNLQGHCYDIEYAACAVNGIENSIPVFQNIQEMVKTSIFLKQQLKYEDVRNKVKQDKNKNVSVYKRFSAHLTLDFPADLRDFGGVVRETSQRVETMITAANSNSRTPATDTQEINKSNCPQTSGVGELHRSHTTLH